MKAPRSFSCHWKQVLGDKVSIRGWALCPNHGALQASVCPPNKVPDVLSPDWSRLLNSAFLVWTYCNHVVSIDADAKTVIVGLAGLPVSGMLELWKQDWLKEHGETPTPPGLWAPAVFVLYHGDLRLPLETLPTFTRWHHQGRSRSASRFL